MRSSPVFPAKAQKVFAACNYVFILLQKDIQQHRPSGVNHAETGVILPMAGMILPYYDWSIYKFVCFNGNSHAAFHGQQEIIDRLQLSEAISKDLRKLL